MLKADDYKKYNSGCRKRLRIPKHYLSKWGYYERNAMKLNPWERKRAKTLYKILGYFTKDERKFLAKNTEMNFIKTIKLLLESTV